MVIEGPSSMKPELSPEAAGPRLRAIAEQLHRLAPSRTNPHAYFEQKSSMVDELRRLALGLDQVVPRRPRALASISKSSTVEDLPAPNPKSERLSDPEFRTVRNSSCRHCLRRRAQQSRRHRLRLRNVDLFEWAARQ